MLFRPDEWWEEQQIELMTRTSVMKLDAGERVATLSNKEEVDFDKALLATGVERRTGCRSTAASSTGSTTCGRSATPTRSARTPQSGRARGADRRELHRHRGRGVADVASQGKQCAIVMLEDVTLERHFGAEVGGFFQRVLEEHGVEVHGGESLARFEGSDGRVRKVVTESGLELECDMVVIGAGVQPDVTLAQGRRASSWARPAGSSARRSSRPRCPASSPPATSASTTASSTASRCASSTGTWPSTTARRRR